MKAGPLSSVWILDYAHFVFQSIFVTGLMTDLLSIDIIFDGWPKENQTSRRFLLLAQLKTVQNAKSLPAVRLQIALVIAGKRPRRLRSLSGLCSRWAQARGK